MFLSFLFLFPLSVLPVSWIFNSQPQEVPGTPITYDYIVIGGGTAGLTVASRLTEDPNVTVVVLEAGSNVENMPEVYIPGFAGSGMSFPDLRWDYETVPQEHLGGRRTIVGAAKALGGGTIVNSMIFTRGEKWQYDAWGSLNNDENWSWSALLPYFKKLEHFTPPTQAQIYGGAQIKEEFHGTSDSVGDGGRVEVGFPNYFYEQSQMWRTATGFQPSPDLSNGSPQGTVGVSTNSLDAHNNTRSTSVSAYYTPFASRSNLNVLTEVTVTKILWGERESHDPPLRASGVEFQYRNGYTGTFNVRREVILAGGTIGSPKILELSGVGNSTILEAAGVDAVLELPTVGENLAGSIPFTSWHDMDLTWPVEMIDHVHSWANAFTNATLTRDSLRLDPKLLEEQRALWELNRTGLLSASPRSLSLALPSQLYADGQFTNFIQQARRDLLYYANLFSNGNQHLANGIEWQYNMMLNSWEQNESAPVELNFEPGYSGPTSADDRPKRKYSSVNAVLLGPLSRGRTHISSSDPFEAPVIDPQYYAHPLDLLTHVKSIELARKMLRTRPLDSIYEGEFEPGEEMVDAEVITWAREVAASDNHAMGSLAMMPIHMGGVVDGRLRVYGIDNVRVVGQLICVSLLSASDVKADHSDASIIPFPISSHIVSTVYAIAEKASDFIIEDFRATSE
ncbi:hypothetical protein CVT25_006126 [Psilocybe cyanescens]|uniref:pyranose dehydrogenase (acceptor) n=1 Tax=Psilocybe cyanescens TaxID=93625 RepID=A0A409WZ25_PSICY|nr:hypothetical protein CVT25_006126 [Psilocybe cyanescens]